MTDDVPWTILSSSVLRAIRYDAGRRQLTVRFTSGRVYEYYQVPFDVVKTLLDPLGGSHGRYFNEVVRDGYESVDITR